MASTTYFVALPFVASEEGPMPVDAVECQSAAIARSTASSLGRNPKYVGAIAFERSGDPDEGHFAGAAVLARYGVTPDDLSGL